MGEIRKIECKKCNSSWQLHIGVGLRHGRPEGIAKAFPEEERAGIEDRLEEAGMSGFEFKFTPGSCPDCKNIVSIPRISFNGGGDEIAGACPVCGKRAVDLYDSIEDAACPRCGEAGLLSSHAGYWD